MTNLDQLISHSTSCPTCRIVTIDYCDVTSPYV